MSDPERIPALIRNPARSLSLAVTVGIVLGLAAMFYLIGQASSPCASAAQCTVGDDETFTGDAIFSDGTIDVDDGGTVTQATNRSTAVTLNTYSGQITMNSASLAAGAEVTFQVNNSKVTANDVVVANISFSSTGTPVVSVTQVENGSFTLTVTNLHASTADTTADEITFVVIKASTT